MSEVLTEPITHRPHEITVQGQELNNQMWKLGEPVIQQEPKKDDPVIVQEPVKVDPPVVIEPKKDEPAFDENKFIKDKFGWDNADAGKQELEGLRNRVKELDLTSEDGKKILTYLKEGKTKDLYNFLHEQEQVNRLVTSDLSDKNIATELVKFGISNKNKNLKPDEVDFLFNERFALPEKPVQGVSELDDDFTPRMDAWKKQVENVEKRLVIEAKLAQPELEQLKAKLILPDIEPQVKQKQPTQEELDADSKFAEAYLKSVDESLKNFSGFSVMVKNEAVGLPEVAVPYMVTDAEKTSLSQELNDFSKNGYNANSLFAQRWVNEDKTLNTKQIAEDRYLLQNRDKIFQKLAEESANKAIDAYIKGKKNIDINQTNVQQTAVITKDDKTEMDTLRDSFFS